MNQQEFHVWRCQRLQRLLFEYAQSILGQYLSKTHPKHIEFCINTPELAYSLKSLLGIDSEKPHEPGCMHTHILISMDDLETKTPEQIHKEMDSYTAALNAVGAHNNAAAYQVSAELVRRIGQLMGVHEGMKESIPWEFTRPLHGLGVGRSQGLECVGILRKHAEQYTNEHYRHKMVTDFADYLEDLLRVIQDSGYRLGLLSR